MNVVFEKKLPWQLPYLLVSWVMFPLKDTKEREQAADKTELKE